MRLSNAVRWLESKDISKAEVVKFYRDTSREVGYSGSINIPKIPANMHRSFSYRPFEEISKGVFYCEEKQLWYKDGTVYSEDSAMHNGIIGAGSRLQSIIQQSKTA